jgi:hypothetical protein
MEIAMWRIWMLVCLAGLGCAPAVPGAESQADLAGYRAIYQRELNAIDSAFAASRAVASGRYGSNLVALAASFQKEGDLQNLTTVHAEQESFSTRGAVAGALPNTAPPALRRLQASALEELGNAERAKAKKLLDLTSGYLATLEKLKIRLTKNNEIDKALEAKAEIEAVRASQDVPAAAALLDAYRPKAAPAIPAAPPKPPAAPTIKDPGLPDNFKTGLILYYGFATKDSADDDGSGKRNRARVRGASWTANGVQGGAMEFEGRGDYIESSEPVDIRGAAPWTISCWAQLGPRVGHFDNFISIGKSFRPQGIVGLARAPGTQAINVNLWSEKNFSVNSGADLGSGFHHLAASYDGSRLSVFVDGDKRIDRGFDLSIEEEPVYIGGRTGGFDGQYLTGVIDEVMVYNRSLADSEIKALYRYQKR